MKKYSIPILIIGLVILFLITQKILMPLVFNVIKSDAFLIQNNDQGSQLPQSNSMTDFAFMHCNNYIKSELGSEVSITFTDNPLHAWSLGNYEYVVNAEATFTEASVSTTKKYACRIAYQNGDNLDGAADKSNWSVGGIDGIDGI